MVNLIQHTNHRHFMFLRVHTVICGLPYINECSMFSILYQTMLWWHCDRILLWLSYTSMVYNHCIWDIYILYMDLFMMKSRELTGPFSSNHISERYMEIAWDKTIQMITFSWSWQYKSLVFWYSVLNICQILNSNLWDMSPYHSDEKFHGWIVDQTNPSVVVDGIHPWLDSFCTKEIIL